MPSTSALVSSRGMGVHIPRMASGLRACALPTRPGLPSARPNSGCDMRNRAASTDADKETKQETAWWKSMWPPQGGAKATNAARAVASRGQGSRAKDVILAYYDAYNAGDIDTIGSLLAEDVSYHDMIYEEPFEGRSEVVAYLKKVRDIVPSDLKFIMDDVTSGDDYKVGIMWHVECGDGVVLPFSRGCSFYTLNEDGLIVQARDIVEPSIKPGSSTLKVLGAVTPLVKELSQKGVDVGNISSLPINAALVWAFYTGYMAYIFFSTDLPGLPVWQTPPEVISEILNESINFFYVNVAFNAIGINFIPSIPEPPVSEAVFNTVNAWGMMFLPLILTDGQSKKVGNKYAWWAGIMFLTNVFFIPFLALRAAPEAPTSSPAPSPSEGAAPGKAPLAPRAPKPPANEPLPSWAPAIGVTGIAVGLTSIAWALFARPEYGGLEERWAYFLDTFSTNRAFFAFILDSSLYCLWQYSFLQSRKARLPAVPFFGLAEFLIKGPMEESKQPKDA